MTNKRILVVGGGTLASAIRQALRDEGTGLLAVEEEAELQREFAIQNLHCDYDYLPCRFDKRQRDYPTLRETIRRKVKP